MIPDAIVGFFKTLLTPVIGLLPTGSLSLPSPVGLADSLRGLDSLVPVLLPLQIGAGMLGCLVFFFGFRVVVFLLNLLIP